MASGKGRLADLTTSASLVSELAESGLAVGGLFVVRMLAPFLVSLVAGVAAHRYSRRRLLILPGNRRHSVVDRRSHAGARRAVAATGTTSVITSGSSSSTHRTRG